MKPRQLHLLTHPAFLFSLFLLLLNDVSLKYEYPNWLTGKLSDFAGLFVFSVFFAVIIPVNKHRTLLSCAVIFVWWKSSLSSDFIHCWNSYIPFQINRVIDYSDLLALAVLPVSSYTLKHSIKETAQPHPIVTATIGLVCIFSFCFTSSTRRLYFEDEKDFVNYNEYIRVKKSEEQVLQGLVEQNIPFHKDSIERKRIAIYYERVLLRTGREEDSSFNWIPVPNKNDSVLFVQRELSPFYVIPYYKLDNDELFDIKFSMYPNKKNLDIYIRSFRSADYLRDPSSKKKNKKRYYKGLTELFK